jgi:hypothetical protein
MTWISPVFTAVRYGNPLSSQAGFGNMSPLAQASLRFSGDAFLIRQELLSEAEATRKVKPNQGLTEKESHFKAIGDTVVWQQGDKALNIADMIAFLCRIRRDEDYPGMGTAEILAKDFPGMNVEALKRGFEKLHLPDYYLGKNHLTGAYWLRPSGEEMLEKLYPDITLPNKKDRFILFWHD